MQAFLNVAMDENAAEESSWTNVPAGYCIEILKVLKIFHLIIFSLLFYLALKNITARTGKVTMGEKSKQELIAWFETDTNEYVDNGCCR